MSNKYIETILHKNKKGSAFLFPQEFVVDGVRYRSIPDPTAAKRARRLFSRFKKYKGQKSNLGSGAEATRDGRSKIGRYIYHPLDPKDAVSLTNRLGTSSESFWSSWFFGNVYSHNPEYRKLSTVGRRLSGYPHSAGMKKRNEIDQNPAAYKGKTDYVMFSFKEAPVDLGDSIIKINRNSPHSFDKFKSHAQQMASHGRVVSRKSSSKVTLHGGNESGTVGGHDLPLRGGRFAKIDSKGMLIHPGTKGGYTGVLKKVKILGPNNFGTIIKSYAGNVFRLAIYSGIIYGGYKAYTTFK